MYTVVKGVSSFGTAWKNGAEGYRILHENGLYHDVTEVLVDTRIVGKHVLYDLLIVSELDCFYHR
jgi:hypothetical protein